MCQAKINLKACKEFVLLLRTCATQNHLTIFSVIYTRTLFSVPILRLQQNWKNIVMSETSLQKRSFVVALKPVLFTNLCMVHAIILIGETMQQIAFINLPFFPSDVLMYVSKWDYYTYLTINLDNLDHLHINRRLQDNWIYRENMALL